jgi:hypothetical protein
MLRQLEVARVATNSPKLCQTKPALRRQETLLLEYRLLETIVFNVNELYGKYMLPSNALVGQFVIFANVTMIRDWVELDEYSICVLSATSLVIMSFWVIVLEVCGKEYSMGMRVLKSWKYLKFQSSVDAKYFHKVKKACPVIQIGMAGFFTVKRKTILNFMKGITRGTFRAVIALKKN